MSLVRDSLRPQSSSSDEAVRRYIAAIRAELEPDPLFRRRLRGTVVNRFVTTREGLEQPRRRTARMGMLGRACLYASVALVMSVGGVMAASRGAVPGDLLYPVKLEIEALRMQALPDHLRGQLAAYMLAERINELGQLVEAGEMEHVAGLAASIEDGYRRLDALDATDASAGVLGARLEVLAGLLDRLPPQAEFAIRDAMPYAPGLYSTAPRGGGAGRPEGTGGRPYSGGGTIATYEARAGGVSPLMGDDESTDAGLVTPRPTSTPKPSHGPSPHPHESSAPESDVPDSEETAADSPEAETAD